MTKTMFMAAAFATSGLVHGASAGSLADPVIEAPLIVEDASSSSSGTSLVLALAIILSIPALVD